jgi:Bacterial Ig domain
METALAATMTTQTLCLLLAAILFITSIMIISQPFSRSGIMMTTMIVQQANAMTSSSSISYYYYYYYYSHPTATITTAATSSPTASARTTDSIPATISTVNEKPVAISMASPPIADEGGSVTLDGTKSYIPDGSGIYYYSWVQVAGPPVGPLSPTAVATFKAPRVDHDTQLQFQLVVEDKKGATSSSYLTIAVRNAEHPPTAYSQSVQTTQNTAVGIELKATDPDPGDTIGYAIVSQPSHGQLSNLNPTFTGTTYIPNDGFSGTDSFSFQAFDKSRMVSNIATVYITVIKVNHPPTAYSQSASTTQNKAVNIQLQATDPGGIITSYTIVSMPIRGTISNFDQSSGTLTYTPHSQFPTGTDRFTFNCIDNHGTASNIGEVSITVNPAPH